MRIGMVTSYYPSENDPGHGVFVKNLVENLQKNGIDVDLIVCRNKLNYLKIPLKNDVDIFHAQFLYPPGFMTGLLSLKPFVTTIHRYEVVDLPNTYRKEFLKFALKRSKEIITVSEYIKNKALEILQVGDKVHVIYNAIDHHKFSPDIDSSALMENLNLRDFPVIFSLGHLLPRKGFDMLLRALKEVSLHTDKFYCLIGGDGPERQRLEKLSKELGLEKNVIFLGTLSDLPPYYALADIYALHTYSEGHCAAVLEAMSSGNAIVTTDIEGNRESVVDGRNGYLVPVGDYKKMADNILFLIENPDICKKMGWESRKIIEERFTWDIKIPEILGVYKKCLE